jgi:hypothetical protein
MNSTVQSLGAIISTLQVTSVTGYISSQLISTTSGLTNQISTSIGQINFPVNLSNYTSTSYVNNAISSFSSLIGPTGSITLPQMISTNTGLGSFGYASTSLVYVPQGQGIRIPFPPINVPVAFAQDWSTPLSTFSTSIGQGITRNISTLFSTTSGQAFTISSFFASIGPAAYSAISSFSSLIGPAISTGSATQGGLATAQLQSTVMGLGNVGYVSASYIYVSTIPGRFAFPPINVPVAYMQDWSTPLSNVQNVVTSLSYNLVNLTNSNINTSNYIGITLSSFSTSFSPIQVGPYFASTVQGFQFISSPYVDQSISSFSSMIGPSISTGLANTTVPQLISTANGLGSLGYASTSLVYVANLPAVNTLPFPNVVFNSIFSVPVLTSTITTNQTIPASSNGAYIFYTTNTANLTVTLPSPATAGNGWNVTIQNSQNSLQYITILTTPSKQISPGITTKFLTDGISFYFV